ncbi:MAG: RecX family transcriptional regulator [Armatimonadetes bacterium]|nr:RecX family transcriptional regulator [Armatimonadota bacterium]
MRRLKTKGFDRRTIDEVLRDLERLGYVNDAEYARALAEQLCSSGQYGRRAVESKLKQRGLPLDVVREAVEEASREIDEYEAARELAEARLRRLTRLDPKKKRERVYGFLMRRGFAADVVHDVIESLLPADD